MNSINERKDFFILSAPRSGSTVLTQTLDKHPKIFCAGELFNASGNIYHPEWRFPLFNTAQKKPATFFALMNYIKANFSGASHIKKFYEEKEKEICGFKLMINHANNFPAVYRYLHSNNFRMIALIRTNVFLQALSGLRAQQLGIYHSKEELKPAEKKYFVNTSLLKKRMGELEKAKDEVLRLSKSFKSIIIKYEDFENWQPTLDKIFEFLDVEKMNISPQLKKISTGNWQANVENYNEVENMIKEDFCNYIS